MIARKTLENEISGLTDLKDLIESYEEIASIRMRRVKSFVLRNREFLSGLNELYHEIINYTEYEKRWKKKQSLRTQEALKKKSVSVLLSSNTMLYGDIIRRTFDAFYKYVESASNTDVVIVGKVGRQMMMDATKARDFKYFDLSDSSLDNEKLRDIYTYISQYKGIYVFHPKFENILKQVPTNTAISEQIMFGSDSDEAKDTQYIFEPSLQETLDFFDKEIVLSILEQTLHESNLSKFVSRMISLDYAVDNISSKLAALNLSHERVKHAGMNSKQLNVMSGISLWKGAA